MGISCLQQISHRNNEYIWFKTIAIYLDPSSAGWVGNSGLGRLGWTLLGSCIYGQLANQLVVDDWVWPHSTCLLASRLLARVMRQLSHMPLSNQLANTGLFMWQQIFKSSKTGSSAKPFKAYVETYTLSLPKHSIDQRKTWGQLEWPTVCSGLKGFPGQEPEKFWTN